MLEIRLMCKCVNLEIKNKQIGFLMLLKFRLSSNEYLQTNCKIH
jgi:hypothetical protein